MTKLKSTHLSMLVLLSAAVVFAAAHMVLRHHFVIKPALDRAGQRGEVRLTAADYPRESRYGYLVPAKAFGVDIALYVPDMPDVRPGDAITAHLMLNTSNNRNFTLDASQARGLTVTHAARVPLLMYPAVIRNAMRARIYALFGERAAPFAAALLTGDRSGFSAAFTSALSVTGLSHTVAISGLHISFIVGLFGWFFGGIRRAAPFTIPVIILFTAVVGFPASAIRACVMNILVLTALLIKRDYDSRAALAAALAVIAAADPYALFAVGTWLSFLSTFGIITFAARWNRAFLPKLKPRFLRGPLKSLSVTAAALIFTIPLVAYVFGVVSLISPLTNLLALPVISVLFIGTILTLGVSLIFMPLAKIAALCLGWGFDSLSRFITTTARLPFAAIYTNNFLTVALLVFQYALLLLCYIAWRRGARRFTVPACAAVCSICAVILGTSLHYDKSDTMRVTAVDVGQGQSIMLSTKGRAVLLDCGGSHVDYTLAPAILSQGASAIDAVILSHFHDDHINGVATLLERVKVHYLIFSDDRGEDTAAARSALEAAAARAGAEVIAISDDMTVKMGDCYLDLFVPRDGGDVNERCLSVLADYNGFTMLTTGDLDAFGERKLLRLAPIPTLDVLVPGHHGSRFSTCETLLHYTRPQAAIISAAAYNRYGHPASETLDRLEAHGVTIYGTMNQTLTITVKGG
ncbi:MAG: DNA internalization-related competence protein ComEC/Rec2 [Oscillospiraceae bacterium]|nr:DNA internalization-related competence protein ComEC/Rec2 [Oscillospiraceae bacterium]